MVKCCVLNQGGKVSKVSHPFPNAYQGGLYEND
jgi:hypothetical protein